MAVRGRAGQVSAALANLTPFAEDTDDILRVLRAQSGDPQPIRDTGEVFAALTERKGQLRELIQNSNRTWPAIASRDQQLADTFTVFPTFLRESRATTQRVTRSPATRTRSSPAAPGGAPAVADADRPGPAGARPARLLPGPRPARARLEGRPAGHEQVLDNTRPLLGRLDPFLRELTPVVDYLGLYKREIAAFFAQRLGGHAGPRAGLRGPAPVHYLRVMNPLNPEIMTGYPNRLGTNRYNPYTEPGRYDRLAKGQPLPVFGSYLCTSNPTPTPPDAEREHRPAAAGRDQALRVRHRHGQRGPGAALRRAGAAGPCSWASPGATRSVEAAAVGDAVATSLLS